MKVAVPRKLACTAASLDALHTLDALHSSLRVAVPCRLACTAATRPLRLLSLDATGVLIRLKRPLGEIYGEVFHLHGFHGTPGCITRTFKTAWKEANTQNPNFSSDTAGARQWWHDLVTRTVHLTHEMEYPVLDGPSSEQVADTSALCEDLYRRFESDRYYELCPDVPAFLQWVGGIKGLQVVVYSNFDDRLHSILQSLHVARHFDRIFTSYELGLQKQDAGSFCTVLRVMGVDEPAAALHVGDSLENDLIPATRDGLQACLVADEEAMKRHPHSGQPSFSQAWYVRSLWQCGDSIFGHKVARP